MSWSIGKHEFEFVCLCQEKFYVAIGPVGCWEVLEEHHDVLDGVMVCARGLEKSRKL